MKKIILLIAILVGIFQINIIFAAGAQEEPGEEVTEELLMQLDQYNFSEIQQILDQQKADTGLDLSFEDLMKKLISGQWSEFMEQLGQAIKDTLFSEVKLNTMLLGQIILLGIIGAIFTNFSQIFFSSQISETGFFVTYLLLFTCLVTSCLTGISVASQVVERIVQFMQALLPAYFMAVAFAGGGVSSLAVYEFTLLVIGAMQWLIFKILIPLTQVYILLIMTSQLAKEDMLSRLTDLIEQIIRWSLKTIIGVVLGFHLIQGMVLPFVDSMKNASLQRLIGIIPGVGPGVNAAAQMIVGSGVVIKNTIGAAAMVILGGLILMPLLKMAVCVFLYQCAAAIMQPVCDKRIISCISSVTKGYGLLIQIMITAVALFVITIAIVCSGSNASYYAM